MRRPPWALVVLLIVGLAVTYGGFSIYGDQHSGVAGTAKVTGCEGRAGKYGNGIHCRGVWTADEDVVVGPVEGADRGDVGKTIDVRIHGSDHATVPSLATPIVLGALGVPITLLCLFGLGASLRRGPAQLAVPPAIHAHLVELVRLRWTGKDPQPVLARLPVRMPPGVVQRLASGGPFGWLIDARLDEIDGRVALEALENDRMSGPDHYRVWEDGTREQLANEHTAYAVPAGASPAEVERIEAEYFAHNGEVQALLAERGFIAGRTRSPGDSG